MRGVTVELGGQTRTLRMDFNAICDLEQHFGKGISHIFAEENIGFSTIRAFYWAALRHENKTLTINNIGDLLQEELANGNSIEHLLNPILTAFKVAGFMSDTSEKK